jgi:hypothetical protein
MHLAKASGPDPTAPRGFEPELAAAPRAVALDPVVVAALVLAPRTVAAV